MTIEIPPELEWVSYLAGSEWPQGDEDAMFRIGGHWRNSADDLATLIPDLNRVRQETIESLSGETATAADEQFKKLFDGDYSVDKLVDAMAAVGDLAWDQGTQIEYTKLQVLSTLAIIAAEIAWAINNSWETLGASLAWIPTFEGFGIAVIRQIANEFLKRIRVAITEAATTAFAVKALQMAGTGAAVGVGIGLGQELAIQLYQESEGHRHEINWGQVGKVALGGAVGGGVGALAHGPLATAFGPSNSIVGKAIKGTVVAFGSGVAGGVGGALAAGGGLDGKEIFGGAGGGAPSGAVHGAAGHGGEVHGGGGPADGPVKVPPPKVDVPDIDIKPDDIGPDTNVPEPPPPYSDARFPAALLNCRILGWRPEFRSRIRRRRWAERREPEWRWAERRGGCAKQRVWAGRRQSEWCRAEQWCVGWAEQWCGATEQRLFGWAEQRGRAGRRQSEWCRAEQWCVGWAEQWCGATEQRLFDWAEQRVGAE